MQNYIYKKKPKSFYTGTHTPTYVGTCICAEEGDKKYFWKGGKKKKMGMNRLFGAWRCFGKNPDLATKVLIGLAGARVLPSNPVRYVMELEKDGYLEDTRTLAIGTAMLYSLAFTVAYLFLYLAYGTLLL